MAGNNASVGISQNRVYKAELSDRCDDLINLLFWMGSRIARIRSKRTYRAVGDRKSRWPRRIRGTSHVGYPGVQNNFRTGCVGARAGPATVWHNDGWPIQSRCPLPRHRRRLFLFGFSWQPPLPYCHPSSPVLQDLFCHKTGDSCKGLIFFSFLSVRFGIRAESPVQHPILSKIPCSQRLTGQKQRHVRIGLAPQPRSPVSPS